MSFSEKHHHDKQKYLQQNCSHIKIQTWITRTFLCGNHMQILFGCFVFTVCLTGCCSQTSANSEWPYRIVGGVAQLTRCEGLGFINATVNECGYCTGGNTGLSQNYGKDCRGLCDGLAVIDCAGDCGGKAYIDECSGDCIGGNTRRTEKDIINPSRDCRGLCLSSGGQYFVNSCGVCHDGGTSPFEDCANKCHLPGHVHMMAKRKCGRCVGGSTDIPESEVIDSCGHCKSEGIECICNGTGTPDPCGECNGGGISCMRVISFSPKAIPNDTSTEIYISGAFRGLLRNMKCLLTTILPNNELGRQFDVLGSSNRTHVRCPVKLFAGLYRVGVSLERGENPEVDQVEDTDLLVYSSNVGYNEMTPSKAVFDRESSKLLTVTFTGGSVPRRPLNCIITGEGWNSKFRNAPSESNSLDSCIIPFANNSLKLNIAPSLNGIHPFKKSFSLTFYASPPEISKYYIAEDGHAVVVVFDRPVNLCNFTKCENVLNAETMRRLGGNATCRWATKQQLVIAVLHRISGDPIRITFKQEILKQDDQKYALPKTERLAIDAFYPQPSSSAQIAISGPSTVPLCGTFTLVGHFSSPKGDAAFFWTASRADQQRLDNDLANLLLASRTTSLTLSSSLLKIGVNYTFILTAEHPGNEKHEARLTISRKSYIGPLVSAFSDVMSQPSVTLNQEITLQADVSLPECANTIENVYLMWSVNNPRVKFDFSSRNSHVYRIAPYSLPENSDVTFTANAYLGNFLNTTTSKISLRVEPAVLKATIKGSAKRIVGNQDGVLVLEGGESYSRKIPLVFQWRCYDENRELCYNYARNATRALLLSREQQKKPKLQIPCHHLKAGQILTFELQVFNANNQYQASLVASTVVTVENGSIPQVVIQSVSAEGIPSVERHPTTGAYNIPAGLPVIIHATVKSVKLKLKSVKWEIKGFSQPFSYSTMKENTYLSLEEGFLVDHGIYLIGLSACDTSGTCGIANLTIHAVPGVALCRLVTPSYTEYELIDVEVKGCSIPTGRQPLTYQLFLHKNGSSFPFTPPQTFTAFTLIGPPSPPNNITMMSVQVCDKVNLCRMFSGNPTQVYSTDDKTKGRLELLDKAEVASKSNDPLLALSLFLVASSDASMQISEDETEAMLSTASKAVVNRFLTSGQLALIYSAMLPLLKKPEKDVKLKALAVMRRATKLAFAHKVKPPSSVLSQGHNNVIEAIKDSSGGPDVMKGVRKTLNDILDCISTIVPVGNRMLMQGTEPGQPTTLLFHQLLDRGPITIKAKSHTGMVEGTVVFEEQIRSRVRSLPCNKESMCGSAVVSMTLYPDQAPYPQKASNPLATPVLDISIRNPETGMVVPFTDLGNSVRMSVTNTGNVTAARERGMAFKCNYWNEQNNEWSDEGLQTMGIEGRFMICWASHLTSFAALEVYDGLSTATIVGIVVASLMGVLIFAMVLFFFMRKKQANTTRVSTEALQPQQPEKMRGMERSVVRVKRMTP